MTSVIKVDNIQSSGGTAALSIDSTGRILTPARPAWSVTTSTSQTITTAGTVQTVTFDSETVDVGGHFDLSNNKYVVPVSGLYQVNVLINYIGNSDSVRYVSTYLYVGSSAIIESITHISNETNDGDYATGVISGVYDLTANDELTVRCTCALSGQVQVNAAQVGMPQFSGFLVG